jgi:hypothetical protein
MALEYRRLESAEGSEGNMSWQDFIGRSAANTLPVTVGMLRGGWAGSFAAGS